MRQLRRICVFCGSSLGVRGEYAEAARAVGRLLAARGIGVVYGGASVGLMGALADATLGAGGEVIGVIPGHLDAREITHRGLSELHVVQSMHERKQLMHDLSDGFVALPGGFGTLEELLEMTTWAQLGLHPHPVGVLNVAGYFDFLASFLERAVEDQLIRSEHRSLLLVTDEAENLLDGLAKWSPPSLEKWIGKSET